MKLPEQWMMDVTGSREEAVVLIRGMKGPRCRASAHSALSLIRGVASVEVSLEGGRATVLFDPRKADADQFRVALGAVGFQAVVLEVMACAA